MERYATDLTLSFWVLLLFSFMVVFQIYYLLPCTTAPAWVAIRVGSNLVGSARKEIIKLKFHCLNTPT